LNFVDVPVVRMFETVPVGMVVSASAPPAGPS